MSIHSNYGNVNPLGGFNQPKSVGSMTKQEIVKNFTSTSDLSVKLQIVKDICQHAHQMGDTKEARGLFMIAACLTLDTSTKPDNEMSRNFLHSALFEQAGNREVLDKFHGAVTSARVMKDFDGSYHETLKQYL